MLSRRSIVGVLAWLAARPASAHGPAPSGGRPGDPALIGRTIEVVAIDNEFSLKALDVGDGETVRFVVRNDGMDPHELTIGTVAEHAEHRRHMKAMMEQMRKGGHAGHRMADMVHAGGVWIEPGRTASFVWTFARTAGLEFACNIPGHYEDGMKGPIRFVR
ncbi:cupredoxin domain-containing protein [Reyranella sp.]|uniref:cupredoxin domain-containing protein n=1 Tax=Reyranella sp. TaxID=1929291 RepID=UPI003BAB7EC6